MGAEVTINNGVIFPWVGTQRVFEPFVRLIRQLRAMYPKGSLAESYAKLLGNSCYGKTGQGLKNKTAFDTMSLESKKIPESDISNGMMAAFVTGFVRAVMGEILNGIPSHRTAISCTTDGILTDAHDGEIDLSGELVQRYGELVGVVS